jgi:hypothetical protein
VVKINYLAVSHYTFQQLLLYHLASPKYGSDVTLLSTLTQAGKNG